MINQILDLAIEISAQGAYHVFVDFSGHTNGIQTGVTESDVNYHDKNYDYNFNKTIYLDSANLDDELLNIVEYLQSIRR